jgi:hypothetical protein
VGDPLILTLCGEVDIAVTDPLRGAWIGSPSTRSTR